MRVDVVDERRSYEQRRNMYDGFLGINTWTDIRKKEICFPVFCLFLAGGILWRITGRKFVAGWADFNGNRDICRNNICAHRRRDRSRRRSPYNSNGVCDDSRRADRNTFCCAFAVWDIFRNSASRVKKTEGY